MAETHHHAIQRTLSAHTRARNDGDAAVYARLFTADATYVVFHGHVLHGHDEIEQLHRTRPAGPPHGSQPGNPGGPQPTRISLRLPDATAALVHSGVRAADDRPLIPGRAGGGRSLMPGGAGGGRSLMPGGAGGGRSLMPGGAGGDQPLTPDRAFAASPSLVEDDERRVAAFGNTRAQAGQPS